MTHSRIPLDQQPLPARLVVWAVSVSIAVVVLAVAARAAMWITGVG